MSSSVLPAPKIMLVSELAIVNYVNIPALCPVFLELGLDQDKVMDNIHVIKQ